MLLYSSDHGELKLVDEFTPAHDAGHVTFSVLMQMGGIANRKGTKLWNRITPRASLILED